MESNVFRWCFIGTGTLAGQVAKEIMRSGRHRIVSVFTRRFEKVESFAKLYSAKAFRTASEAISSDDVDGVYVVTPHNSHYEYVKLALELGKPVLCEKSFTTDALHAEELIRLAEEKGVYLTEAMWTWFSPVANKVSQWLSDGEFGEIHTVIAHYHFNSQGYAPRVTDPNRAGGALLDVGVYPITYLYRLFGMPVEIKCCGVLKNGIDLYEDVALTFQNGKTFIASASVVDYKGLEKLKIIGTDARTCIPFFHSTNKAVLHRRHGKKEVFLGDGSMTNEFDRASEEIRNGQTESKFVPHKATLDVMKIMDECRRQMNLIYPFEQESAENGK